MIGPSVSTLIANAQHLNQALREAKGLSQKEVALACKMDTANYSRIESGKTDPAFSSV